MLSLDQGDMLLIIPLAVFTMTLHAIILVQLFTMDQVVAWTQTVTGIHG